MLYPSESLSNDSMRQMCHHPHLVDEETEDREIKNLSKDTQLENSS